MSKLVLFELKKLIKKKSNILIILLLLILPWLQLYNTLSNVTITPNMYNQEVQGIFVGDENYENLEALQYIDHTLHGFAGEINSDWNKKLVDAESILEKSIEDVKEVDEEYMINHYGPDWKEYYEKGERGELTIREFEEISKGENASAEGSKNLDDVIHLKLQYTTHYRNVEGSRRYLLPKVSFLDDPQKYLVTQEKLDILSEYRQRKLTNNPIAYDENIQVYADLQGKSTEEIEYFNQKFLDRPFQYDSTIAVEVMLKLFSNIIFMVVTTLLLGMLLINVFNQEYEHKTDQLLHPIKIHMGKQGMAKIMLIFLCTTGTFMYQLIVYFGMVQFLIGFHDLNVIFQNVIYSHDWFDIPVYTGKEIIMTCSVLFLSSSICFAGLISFLSSFAKRSFSAILLYICICLAMVLPFSQTSSMVLRLSTIVPISAFQPELLFYSKLANGEANINVITLFSTAIPLSYILVPAFLMIAAAMALCAVLYYKKRQIRNA